LLLDFLGKLATPPFFTVAFAAHLNLDGLRDRSGLGGWAGLGGDWGDRGGIAPQMLNGQNKHGLKAFFAPFCNDTERLTKHKLMREAVA